MIYYLIFCIATTILSIWRCQVPVVKFHSPKTLNSITFWCAIIVIDMFLAPILFIVTIFMPETYMMNMEEYFLRNKK